MSFNYYIGIDYSGAETPGSRLKGLQVSAAFPEQLPEKVITPAAPQGVYWNWSRREIATWLIEQIRSGKLIVIGIDHGFSFPLSYYERYGLSDWDTFLNDFCRFWPTDQEHIYVDQFRQDNQREGHAHEFRLTEKWTSSTKSVFRFDVQGQVAKSTHAGIPWLYRIRNQVADRVHFWPFDGFDIPPGKSVIAEVYPSIFRNRYPRESGSPDEQDAYSVARWLEKSDRRGILERYFHPPLNEEETRIALLEGWILGIN